MNMNQNHYNFHLKRNTSIPSQNKTNNKIYSLKEELSIDNI